MINQIDARQWREIYGRLEDARATSATAQEITDAINAAFTAVNRTIRQEGYQTEGTDDAEALVGAITWFFFRSNPSFLGAVPAPKEAR